MRFFRLFTPVFVLVLVLGVAVPAGAQSCLLGLLCGSRIQPPPAPAPALPPPPPAPALPPADSVTEPVTGAVDSVHQALKTPVSAMESQMLSLINAERAKDGLHPLQVSGWAASFARAFSQKMMAAGNIWHNPDYFSKGRAAMGATLLSENVAYDSSIPANHAGLMGSPGHRANILDGRLTHVGIGVAVSPAGRVYVTQDFARIPGSAAASADGRRGPAETRNSRPGAAPAGMSAPGAGEAVVGADTTVDTITLGKAAGGKSEASGALSAVASTEKTPMVSGLVTGGLVALLTPLALFGKKLLLLFGM